MSLYQLGRRAAVHPIGYRPITHYGALLDAPPVFDRTNGFNGFRMLGNGPDPTLTVNHGKPVGDCLVEGTMVRALNVDAAYRARYRGPVVQLTFASGAQLTVTPNHAVLTPTGFTRAHLMQKGDYAVRARRGGHPPLLRQQDFDQPPVPVEQVFASLLGSGSVPGGSAHQGVVVPAVDFHGDERFVDGDVHIVRPDRFLRGHRYASLGKPQGQRKVRPASESESVFHRLCTTLQGERVPWPPPLGAVGLGDHLSALAWRQLGVMEARRLGEGPDGDSSVHQQLAEGLVVDAGLTSQRRIRLPCSVALKERPEALDSVPDAERPGFVWPAELVASVAQPVPNGPASDPELYTYLLHRLPGLVETDHLVDIQWEFFNGHVYDLSSTAHWYFANDIITHNCAFVGTENVTVVDQIECGEPPTFPTSDLVVSTYLTYDHGQDKGANLSELLAYWHNHGLPWAGKNCGYASANFRDIDEFWAAVYAFGCGYIGILVTEAMQQQTAAGEPWDITGTDMDERVVGGHCVVPIARTSAEGDGEVATWGMRQPFTARWFKTFVEEAHVVVTPAQKARGGNGAGIDFEHLERDLVVVERLARGA